VKPLTRERFEAARRYMEESARPLERELFRVRFDGVAIDGTLSELGRYQNPDRGFGLGLEPDMRSPGSSSLHTGIALSHLRDLGVGPDHPLVLDAIAYLADTLEPETHVWRPTSADVNDHPHGPWWNDHGEDLEELFDRFVVIPRARIASLLYRFVDAAPSRAWLDELAEETVASIEALPNEKLWSGTLAYALELADEPSAPEALRRRLADRILPVLRSLVTLDDETWPTYCTPPVLVAPRPDSVGAELIRADIERNLDWLIERQTERGCWEPNWLWGKAYPEAWEEAKREWCGVVTYETLSALRAYGRLASA